MDFKVTGRWKLPAVSRGGASRSQLSTTGNPAILHGSSLGGMVRQGCEPWAHTVTGANPLLGVRGEQRYPPTTAPQTDISSSWMLHSLGLWFCLLHAAIIRELVNTKCYIYNKNEVVMEQMSFSEPKVFRGRTGSPHTPPSSLV